MDEKTQLHFASKQALVCEYVTTFFYLMQTINNKE